MPNLDLFENYELIDELIEVQVADGRGLRVEAKESWGLLQMSYIFQA
jgi:hypothetical protein